MVDAAWFRGGRVFTGVRWVDAVATESGQVVAAGSDAEVRRSVGQDADHIDLAGRLVVPGLIDAHLHLGGMVLERVGVHLTGARTPEEIVDRCTAWSVDHPNGPVVGRGWDQERMEGGAYPTRSPLDRAFPDREVVLYRVCGHAALVNGATLEALEISAATDDPVGGRIVRDPQGSATGVLLDSAMTGLGAVRQRATAANPAVLSAVLGELASVGLTTVAWMSAAPTDVREAAERATTERPPVRLRFYVAIEALDEIVASPREWAGGLLRISGVKAITDGSFGAHTAWLSEPYDDRPDDCGLPVGSTDELADEIAAASAVGLQVALHAIGDRAIYRALRLLQAAAPAPTPRIEHASLVPPNLYALLDRVQPHLVVQPRFVVSDWWLSERLGSVRARFAYPFRSLLERGYQLAGSSDAPVEPSDPWTGIHAAVHRGPTGDPRRAGSSSEHVRPEVAVGLYTAGAGSALEEPGLGLLEVGSPADLVVLRVPTLERAVEAGNRSVAETWRGGERTYQSG